MTAQIVEFKAAQKRETQAEKILRLCQEAKECMRHVLFDLEEDRNLFTSELYAEQALEILIQITSNAESYRQSYTGMLCAFYVTNMRLNRAQQWVKAHRRACQAGNDFSQLEALERFDFSFKRESQFRSHVGSYPDYAAECFHALELSRQALDVAKAMQIPIAEGLKKRRSSGTDFRIEHLPFRES